MQPRVFYLLISDFCAAAEKKKKASDSFTMETLEIEHCSDNTSKCAPIVTAQCAGQVIKIKMSTLLIYQFDCMSYPWPVDAPKQDWLTCSMFHHVVVTYNSDLLFASDFCFIASHCATEPNLTLFKKVGVEGGYSGRFPNLRDEKSSQFHLFHVVL